MTSADIDATSQDGTYPRPQLMRAAWSDLCGDWECHLADKVSDAIDQVKFDRSIVVPFPPESPASGIGDTAPRPAVWYRRVFGAAEIRAAGYGADAPRMLLHFGAVDWAARVWVNGLQVADHIGGQTPFTADITAAMNPNGENTLVVRAIDDPSDVSILRGKQDWREHPHAIWYHRTTGIWQPVWLEAVPRTSISALRWRNDVPGARVDVDVQVTGAVDQDTWVDVAVQHGTELLAQARVRVWSGGATVNLTIPAQQNGQAYDELLWRPDRPTLLRAHVQLVRSDQVVDGVASYLGLRSVSIARGHFLLNDRPIYLRAVLAQNYWPSSHLAAPNADALRREVQAALELGFNTARVHQKAEDPRFLYWADKLGLMLWAETANAYAFDARSVHNLVREWTALVDRDESHPSIIAWVPLNESWGVQHIAHDRRQQAFSRSIADLTRALDGSRPVISNDGWEHTASDILTVHDYDSDPERLRERYSTAAAVAQLREGYGPAGRILHIEGQRLDAPLMLTEFGGVSLRAENSDDWGYSTAQDTGDFARRVIGLIEAASHASLLHGFCYTQLTDTGQETNGLLYADRTLKISVTDIRHAVRNGGF